MELGSSETALVKLSMFKQGALRVGFVVNVSGTITSQQLLAGVAALQAAHPVLRCTVVTAGNEIPTADSVFALELRDDIELPAQIHAGDASLGVDAWQPVWLSVQKVCTHNVVLLT